jgi:hypothetical protein
MGDGTTGIAMASQRGRFRPQGIVPVLGALALFGVGICAFAPVTSAQDAPPQGQQESPPAAATPPRPDYRPGFIDAFGRWLEEGRTKFKSNMDSAHETFGKVGGQMRDAAKDATGAIMTMPNARVVTGRVRCEAAPNGAPDCKAAAAAICKGKGFQGGNSMDTVVEEKCPARVFLEARSPAPGECRQETYVTRAVCQ